MIPYMIVTLVIYVLVITWLCNWFRFVIYAMPWMIMILKDHAIIVVKFCDIKSNNYYEKMHKIVEI
jgi:hypothetical protein